MLTVCMCTLCMLGVCQRQGRAQDPMELELQVSGTTLWDLSPLNYQDISPAFDITIKTVNGKANCKVYKVC